MERFTLIRTGQGNYLATRDDGDLVSYTDAQAAIDAANQRATDAERRLALAVAEVRAVRALERERTLYFDDTYEGPTNIDEVGSKLTAARRATDADQALAKMIGGGE